MQIDKTSWHYSLMALEFSGSNIEYMMRLRYTTLCQYCRALLWKLSGYALLFAFLFACAALIFFVAIGLPGCAITHLFGSNICEPKMVETGFAVVILEVLAILCCAIAYFWKNYDWGTPVATFFHDIGEALDRRYSAKKVKKEPGLLMQWLKAVKEKTCPIIEYTDSKTENTTEKE